jgi:hypothetical protein
MHDQPEPTEEEQEHAQTERQEEEEAMRYPGHEDAGQGTEEDEEE